MVPAAIERIEDAIRRFKARVEPADATGDDSMSAHGARFWAKRIGDEIVRSLRALPDDADAQRFAALACAAAAKLSRSSDAPELGELRRLSLVTDSSGRGLMQRLMFHGHAGGVGLEALLWTQLNDPRNLANRTPALAQYRSFVTLATLARWNDEASQFHALMIARRYKARGPSAPGNGTLALDHARDALDAGHVLHARVIGDREHSIVIVGHDGDTLVYHDAAAARACDPEPGFGLLRAAPAKNDYEVLSVAVV